MIPDLQSLDICAPFQESQMLPDHKDNLATVGEEKGTQLLNSSLCRLKRRACWK